MIKPRIYFESRVDVLGLREKVREESRIAPRVLICIPERMELH